MNDCRYLAHGHHINIAVFEGVSEGLRSASHGGEYEGNGVLVENAPRRFDDTRTGSGCLT